MLARARARLSAPTRHPTGKKLAAKESRGKDLSRETVEGIHLKTVYGPEDAAGIDSGYPGVAPFTRGPYATMYAGGRGPSASMPASRPPRNPTPSTAATSPRGRRA